jgi:N6-adenosine-specific RNA methylase IME4
VKVEGNHQIGEPDQSVGRETPAEGNHLPIIEGGWQLVLSDPPWRFATYSAKGKEKKSAENHYATMDLDDIFALPVRDIMAKDSVCVMWATAPMLDNAMSLLAYWGFTYKTMGVWAKRSKTGAHWAFGTGYHLRSTCEPFLIGTTGKPKIGARDVRNLIESPVRLHSQKPDEMYGILERLYPCERRLEMFSRTARAGWTAWGNETGKLGAAA